MINRRWLFYILIELFLCFFSFGLIQFDLNQVITEKMFGLLVLINLSLYILFLKVNKLAFFTVGNLFIIFLYLFNLGIPISRLFGWMNTRDAEINLKRRIYSMGTNTLNMYMLYSFLVIVSIEIGYLYYDLKMKASIKQVSLNHCFEEKKYSQNSKLISYGGILLIVVGIIPYFYSEYYYILGSIVYGYQNENNPYNLSGTGLGLLGNLVILGFFALAVAFKNKKHKFDVLFLAVVFYQLVRMYITGDRSTGLTIILVFVLMRHYFIERIKGKQVILVAILSYFGMVFLKIIEMTRSLGGMNFQEAFTEVLKNNIIAETVVEFGGNVWSGMMVMYSVPSTSFFRCGLTYIAALIGKPFSILKISNKIWEYADFSFFLQQEERGSLINALTAAMGGSFTGELWFNFGWLAIVIASLFGVFLGWFSKKCFDSKNDPFLTSYLFYIATLLLWWPRQYFTSVSWYAIVYGIVMFFLRKAIVWADKEQR